MTYSWDALKKVKMIGCKDDLSLCGLLLTTSDSEIQAGELCESDDEFVVTREFEVKSGERILGVRSQMNLEFSPQHYDLVFVIGRIE